MNGSNGEAEWNNTVGNIYHRNSKDNNGEGESEREEKRAPGVYKQNQTRKTENTAEIE